jgi:uncharacterized protein (DUF2235 family)
MMMLTLRAPLLFTLASLLTLLTGCANIVYQQQLATYPAREPHKWLIFFDGTANDISDDTNVKRLHSLISLQNRPDVGTLYVEGVGVGNDIFIGAGMGGGFSRRVRLGYEFLLKNYKTNDQIYIFGFSRGAYQARALASMLQYVGLPDKPIDHPVKPIDRNDLDKSCQTRALYAGKKSEVKPRDPEDFVNSLYLEMKAGLYDNELADCVAMARKELNFKSRQVEVLGLWDTVEALGKPDWTSRLLHKTGISPQQVVIDESNKRYGDQLLNVAHVFHAVSIDDDREWIFTPLLVSRSHLLQPKTLPLGTEQTLDRTQITAAHTQSAASGDCKLSNPASSPDIQEVFFSGAHSDVGGGYADSDLSGVSLNWMINRLATVDCNLLPAQAQVREDPYGSSHDPESGWWHLLYHKVSRNLAAYAMGDIQACANSKSKACEVMTRPQSAPRNEPLPAFKNTLCVHESVFKRRKAMAVKDHENHLLQLTAPGNICVEADNSQLANPPIYKEVIGSPPTRDASGQLRCDDASAQSQQPAVPISITEWRKEAGKCVAADAEKSK